MSNGGSQVEDFLKKILPLCWTGKWLSIDDMAWITKLDPRTVRWCLRQLRTGEEGQFIVRKRKREPIYRGITEIYIKRKPSQMRFTFEPHFTIPNDDE